MPGVKRLMAYLLGLDTFTEEILNGKLHFLCGDSFFYLKTTLNIKKCLWTSTVIIVLNWQKYEYMERWFKEMILHSLPLSNCKMLSMNYRKPDVSPGKQGLEIAPNSVKASLVLLRFGICLASKFYLEFVKYFELLKINSSGQGPINIQKLMLHDYQLPV